MKHHTHDDHCPSCEEKLTQAHPILCLWFRSKVKAKHPEAHISWSFRNKDEQTWAFDNGKSKAPWPHSRHNKTDPAGRPCAEALDLFRLAPNGTALFPISWYRQIADEVVAAGDPIKWGGTFKNISDLDHYQVIESDQPDPQTGQSPSS